MKKLVLLLALSIISQWAAAQPESITAMTFGEENDLFIADSKSTTIFASKGAPYIELPMVAHVQSDNQDKKLIASIVRDSAINNLKLVSYEKSGFVRLDDVYFGEYGMPSDNKLVSEKMRKNMVADLIEQSIPFWRRQSFKVISKILS